MKYCKNCNHMLQNRVNLNLSSKTKYNAVQEMCTDRSPFRPNEWLLQQVCLSIQLYYRDNL